MGQRIKFRPNLIVAAEDDVSRVRELAIRYNLPRKRVYGLTIEFAVEADGFETFVQKRADPEISNETD